MPKRNTESGSCISSFSINNRIGYSYTRDCWVHWVQASNYTNQLYLYTDSEAYGYGKLSLICVRGDGRMRGVVEDSSIISLTLLCYIV